MMDLDWVIFAPMVSVAAQGAGDGIDPAPASKVFHVET
jgi:hypothetical protein